MTDIEVIRELHCYKKMYNILQRSITECIEVSRDPVVREKLIKVQQEAEEIYIGEEYEYRDLNADERVIVALLNYITDIEILYVEDRDMTVADDCVDWALVMQNKKVELSKEFIEEQVNKIIAMANEETDSEQ